MKSLNQNPIPGYRWEIYKRLELISNLVPNPYTRGFKRVMGLDWAWRSLLSLLIDELIEEQQVDYLERCWDLDESEETKASLPKSVQRFWRLMD